MKCIPLSPRRNLMFPPLSSVRPVIFCVSHNTHIKLDILNGVFASPFSSRGFVASAVRFVHVGNFWNEWVVWVGVRQHGADGEQNLRDGQGRAPLISQNVEADASIRVDVRVIDARGEVDLGWLKGVVCREVDCEEEYAARIW